MFYLQIFFGERSRRPEGRSPGLAAYRNGGFAKKMLKISKRGLTTGLPCDIIYIVREASKPKERYLGVAQFGSVLEWGSRGRKFESSHPDGRSDCEITSFFVFWSTIQLFWF